MPPRMRDSKVIMGALFRLVLGPKYKYYMEFKDHVSNMTEEEINKYYEILADTFMKRETDLNEGCIQYILENANGKTILDAATGKGYLSHLLKEKGEYERIAALDIVLPEKREKEIEYFAGSLTSLPFQDNEFDVVVCTHALEHIKDYDRALSELRRVCKKKLIIVVPRQREYRYTFDLHINFFPYMYSFKKFINNENAKYMEIGHDFLCVEEFN